MATREHDRTEALARSTQATSPTGQLHAALLGTGQRFRLSSAAMTIGRDESNDVVLSDPDVSRRHAVIELRDDAHWISDLGSKNGTRVNGEVLTSPRKLRHGDAITVGPEALRFVLGRATRVLTGEGVFPMVEPIRLDQARLTIGRDEDNDLVLDNPNVSRFHAEISKTASGVVIRDLGSTNRTYVDGQPVDTAELVEGSEIRVGPVRLVFDGEAFLADDQARRFELEARGVAVSVEGKRLLAPLDLRLRPREFTAIIGESGAGKSTLIRVLAGVSEPSEGSVAVNGDQVMSRTPEIAYVPQQEIVHDRLTIREALGYAARLRLAEDLSSSEFDVAVERVLRQVELTDHAETRIGSLSGGQRRRVGVAVELLGQPGLVFMDEPTTGLDPGLEARLMGLFARLADDSRSVVIVTHATQSLEFCSRVIVLGRGGQLRFNGRPRAALKHFGVESYAEIYNILADAPEDVARERPRRPAGKLTRQQRPAIEAADEDHSRRSVARQSSVLARRYLRVFQRDRRNVAILIGQVPLIALGAAALFKGGIFSHGSGTADAAQLLFLLVTIAVWLGSVDAAREIVKEREIVARERAVGVRVRAYMQSKLIVLLAVGAVQVALLCAIVFLLRPLHQPPSAYLAIGIVLLLTSFAAIGMGLLVSAGARSQDQAISFVPLVLIPQLFFAGAIIPVAKMSPVVADLSALVFARWSFAGVGSAAGLNHRFAIDPVAARVERYGHSFFSVAPLAVDGVLLLFVLAFVVSAGVLVRRRVR